MSKTGPRSRAIWFCDECSPEQEKGSEPCGACCGFRSILTIHDLNISQRAALTDLLLSTRRSGVSWVQSSIVDKRSLYALERRGLVVRNGYEARTKLTPVGLRLAEEASA